MITFGYESANAKIYSLSNDDDDEHIVYVIIKLFIFNCLYLLLL
jgi:hypothetical protein